MKIICNAIFLILIIFFTGCSQNPMDILENPTVYSHTSGIEWIIFEDDLNTLGGDVLYFPSDPGTNTMQLSLVDDGSAYSGNKYFHFKWTGDKIFWEADPPDNPSDTYEFNFAGVSLIVATSPDYYDIAPALDMSDKGYTKIVFYARGELAQGYYAKFEGPGGAVLDKPNLTANWTKYEIQLKDLDNVKDFFKATIYNDDATETTHGTGGYIDIDLIKYSK